MWTDLAKFRRFGKSINSLAILLRVYVVFFTILNLLWQIFIVVNGQTSNKLSLHLVKLLQVHSLISSEKCRFVCSAETIAFFEIISCLFASSSTSSSSLLLLLLLCGPYKSEIRKKGFSRLSWLDLEGGTLVGTNWDCFDNTLSKHVYHQRNSLLNTNVNFRSLLLCSGSSKFVV